MADKNIIDHFLDHFQCHWYLNWLLFSSDCQGNVLGMVQDIADCLVWAQESGPKFNVDKVRNIFKYSLKTEENC